MLFKGALEIWSRKHHGPRVEATAISYIAKKVDMLEAFGFEDDINLNQIFLQCQKECTPDVSVSTLYRWWKIYLEWGEIPTIVKKKKIASQKKQLETGGRTTIDDEQLLQLKELIDEYPQLYLDEISLYFGVKTGVYLLTCTIWRYMTNNLGYSLRVLSEVSKKRNEMEEIRFLNTLSINLQEHPEILVLIDETHKDRNAARRRRGWRKVNSDVESNEWYRHCVRYTLIAAADSNGFVTSA